MISHNPHKNQTYDFTCWPNALSFCTLYLAGLLLLQLFSDPVKPMSRRLAPFRGYDFVGIVCNELGFHRQLASSDITQFGVIWVQKGATKAHNLISGLHSSYSPFNTPILSPPATYHSYCYHLWYYFPLEISCPKQGIIWVPETCIPTQWLLIDGWIIGANFVCTALGTGKLPHNDYLKSPYLLKKVCASKSGFVISSHDCT